MKIAIGIVFVPVCIIVGLGLAMGVTESARLIYWLKR